MTRPDSKLADHAGATRIGLIVPSSNVTMERELPRLLASDRQSYSFHASRMRMTRVSPEELRAMDAQAERCVQELADAHCEVLAYACLIAVMVQGAGAHRRVEAKLQVAADATGTEPSVVSSAGALVNHLKDLGAARVAVLTPYKPELTQVVVDYLGGEGIAVCASASLGIDDNDEVGRIRGDTVLRALDDVDVSTADALVLSACVQMPTLDVLDIARARFQMPVVTAATATAAAIEEATVRRLARA